MRANLVLEEKPATEKQIQYIIWFLGPNEQQFKLKKGTDGKHRWPDAKEVMFPQTGGMIRIIGHNQFEAKERHRAQTTDCRSPEELNRDYRPRTSQRKKDDSAALVRSAMGSSLAISPGHARAAMSAAAADCRFWFGEDAFGY